MRLYIAGPMTGLKESNYPEFLRVEKELEGMGYKVLNPARIGESFNIPDDPSWQWFMRHALRMTVTADGIATLPGWQASRGASLEVHVALRIELPVRPWWEW